MYKKIILFMVLIFSINIVYAQHHHEKSNVQKGKNVQLFSSQIEGNNFSVFSGSYPLLSNNNITFNIDGLNDNFSKEYNISNISLIAINPNDSSTLKKDFNKNSNNVYSVIFKSANTGFYRFEITFFYSDSMNNNKNASFSFSQEVKENVNNSDNSQSHGFMGMGPTMLIIMGAVMVTVMALVMIISANHR
jgi:hypothetical protein